MSNAYKLQATGEVIKYTFDFTDALQDGDLITAQAVTATDATIQNEAISSPFITCEILDVSFGRVAQVVCAATTNNGDTIKKAMVVRGAQR